MSDLHPAEILTIGFAVAIGLQILFYFLNYAPPSHQTKNRRIIPRLPGHLTIVHLWFSPLASRPSFLALTFSS